MIGPIQNPLWQEWAATALAEGRLSWRVTDAQGRPCNGGDAGPIPLGEWSPTTADAALCRRGWHTTSDPIRWKGSRVWLVEGDGLVGTMDDKRCWRRIRPLAEVDPRQSVCQRISVAAMRPYLSGARLSGADLTGASLSRAYLTGADLTGADLTGADLDGGGPRRGEPRRVGARAGRFCAEGDTMTSDQIDLARRLVAHSRWRWLPGMLAVEWPTPRMGLTERPIRVDRGWSDVGMYLPDLSDPATLGCVLALVREAWGNPRLVAIYCEAAHPGQSEGWAVQHADNRLPVAGEDYGSEAEAIVAALEAA